jgi:CRISPR-associated endonuclease/helicase Cas3
MKAEEILAKGSRGGARGDNLVEHTLRVLEVLRSLRRRHPHLAEQVGDGRLWVKAERSLLVHDMGKAARPFQDYLLGKAGPWRHRHEVLSLLFLPAVVDPASDDYAWIAATVASHHRDASCILHDRYPLRADPEDIDLLGLTTAIDDETQTHLRAWLRAVSHSDELGPSGLPTHDPAEIVQLGLRAYQGLLRRIDDTRSVAVALRGLSMQADHVASAGHSDVATVALVDGEELVKRLRRQGCDRGKPLVWRGYQTALASVDGSVVATAPTGSGKTEAALLWAHRQQQLHEGGLLIYLLPYQASANAMASRLRRILNTSVALLHGRSAEVAYREAVAEEAPNPDVVARRMHDLARLRQPGVWVTTIYQLLRAAYQVPGWEALWVSLSSAKIIVDEVHAYEPERTGMLLAFLNEAQSKWGANVCTLTATAPTWLRDAIREELNCGTVYADEDTYRRMRRHRLEVLDGELLDSKNLEDIVRSARRGTSILVTANTVSRARQVRERLAERLGDDVLLLHSRFAMRDRLAKEDAVAKARGAELELSERHPLVLVATQVVEVSLNLDFDCLYSDPAPLEALIQRFGRVNRKGRLDLAPVRVLTRPVDGSGVYETELVQKSLAVCCAADGEAIDEKMLAHWLDRVYAQELASSFRRKVSDSARRFRHACLHNVKPFESNPELADEFDRLFDGTEVLPLDLLDEYRAAAERSTLEASNLLVPASDRLLASLKRSGMAAYDRALHQWLVRVPYDPRIGLGSNDGGK